MENCEGLSTENKFPRHRHYLKKGAAHLLLQTTCSVHVYVNMCVSVSGKKVLEEDRTYAQEALANIEVMTVTGTSVTSVQAARRLLVRTAIGLEAMLQKERVLNALATLKA